MSHHSKNFLKGLLKMDKETKKNLVEFAATATKSVLDSTANRPTKHQQITWQTPVINKDAYIGRCVNVSDYNADKVDNIIDRFVRGDESSVSELTDLSRALFMESFNAFKSGKLSEEQATYLIKSITGIVE